MPYRRKSFVEKNFLNLVILVLIALVLLQKCGGDPSAPQEPKIIRDTTWIIKDSTVYSKPQLIKTIPINVSHDTIINHYIPDTNYAKLVLQYQSVVNELLAKNIHTDTIKIDTFGYVNIIDTVQKNLIVGRDFKYKITYPMIKETIIMPEKKKNQVFVGGNIQGSTSANQINAGLLFKTKKDYIFGGTIGVNNKGSLQYGVQSFWKIKIK